MVSSLQQPEIHFYFQHPPASSTYRKRPTNHNKPLKHHGTTADFTGGSVAWLDSKPTGGCQGTSTKGIYSMLDILSNTSCLPRETSSQSWEGVWIIFWSLFYGIMFDSMRPMRFYKFCCSILHRRLLGLSMLRFWEAHCGHEWTTESEGRDGIEMLKW